MVQLLVQVPDVETLNRLLDVEPLAVVAREPAVHVVIIREGKAPEVLR